jgi:hypothetical protein
VSNETPEERLLRLSLHTTDLCPCDRCDLDRLRAEVDHLHRQRVDLADELAEVSDECDRLRHGEKVRGDLALHLHADLMACLAHWEIWRGSCCPCDNTPDDPCRLTIPYRALTPDEVAVLAALDTEEDR